MAWFSRTRKKESDLAETGIAAPVRSPLPNLDAALLSDQGCHRNNNQDSGEIAYPRSGGSENATLLVVVADGMGGHQAGEIASQTAVKTIVEVYERATGTAGEALEEAFAAANRAILQLATKNKEMAGMGTTCTALAVVGREAWAAHVGDSRLYLIRGDAIYQLSEDHTAIQQMVRQGLLTAEAAEHHEDRNVLIRAMGTKPDVAILRWPEPMDIRDGDAFLLCSDGLHDLVRDAEMLSVVKGAAAEEACRKLILMAKQRGGYDNITVAVVTIYSNREQPESLKETRQIEVRQ